MTSQQFQNLISAKLQSIPIADLAAIKLLPIEEVTIAILTYKGARVS